MGTALTNSVDFCWIRPQMYIDDILWWIDVTLTIHNVTLSAQKPYQHNNKCDYSKIND